MGTNCGKHLCKGKHDCGSCNETKHGKWKVKQTLIIRTEGKPTYSETYQCSVCGEWNDKKQNFCPNCGAKMGLEAEDV